MSHLKRKTSLSSTRQVFKPTFRLTDGGADERGRVSDVVETLSLDEVGHGGRKVLVMSLHVVFQDQTAQRSSRLICRHTKMIILRKCASFRAIVSLEKHRPSDFRLVRTKMR